MTMTDPIADMLTRLRNANQAYHDSVTHAATASSSRASPRSSSRRATSPPSTVAEPAEGGVGKTLDHHLKYGRNRERSIAGVRRISKPGLRVYAKSTGLPKVLGGLGVAIISTSHRPAHRPPGQPEGRGWGSPRLRLVTGDQEENSMSRIGKLPVPVPSGVDVTIDGHDGHGQGPQGHPDATPSPPRSRSRRVTTASSTVTRPDDERESRSLHGLTRTLVNNMVVGVTDGYEKKLEIVGVGYRVLSKGPTQLEFQLGYSHSITFNAPDGITFTVENPTQLRRPGHRQAAGRRGRRQHPQAPQARALQGQGRALRRRARPPQGRKGW